MSSKKIKVVKIPLPSEIKNKTHQKAFSKMPILYLELIENKAKIKPELVNKEYVPNVNVKDETEERVREDYSSPESSRRTTPDRDNHESDDEEKRSNESDDEEKKFSDNEDEEGYSEKLSEKRSEKHSDERATNRLKELLEDSDNEEKVKEEYSPPSRREKREESSSFNAPSLKDLEKSGKFVRRKEVEDIAHTTLSEQEQEDAKRELLFKFELLKKSYKTDNLPEFSIHSDYETMKKSYESTLRTLSLDRSVDDYKKYLIGGFMLMEFVLGNWMGFDMQGFTQQQIISMSSYERLLIELGEKSYVPTGSKWPVEVRLLFLVVMNAAFFIISKMILKKTGSNLMGMINNMNGANTGVGTAPSILKKRKMKGPSVNLDDIPDVDEAKE